MHGMKVFISNTNLIASEPERYAEMLSPRQRKRALKYTDETQKLQFILGRLMAKYSGKKYTSISACDNVVVVAAASNARVGIDMENANLEYEYRDDNPRIRLPQPRNKKEVLRNYTFTKSIYRLGTFAHCRQFMRCRNYVICVTSNRWFGMPYLRRFHPDSIFRTDNKKH